MATDLVSVIGKTRDLSILVRCSKVISENVGSLTEIKHRSRARKCPEGSIPRSHGCIDSSCVLVPGNGTCSCCRFRN